ncbi:MAG TPA: alpha/beta hydrolase [Bacteroidia bacterium]|nr:alpha/beta hydrolase [Bacteroidia bacterium]
MRHKEIVFGNYALNYEIYGQGKKLLLAFHGFGRKAEDFQVFESLISTEYTIVSFNLFFHNSLSIYDSEIAISKSDLALLIPACLKIFDASSCSIMGYSIGGRIAMVLYEEQPKLIDELFLLAPDGLKSSFVYNLAIKTKFGKWVFRSSLQNAKPILALSKILYKLKIINKQIHQFGLFHLEDKAMRKLVYDVWMFLRNISPDLKMLKRHQQQFSTRVEIFFGQYDPVIRPEFHKRIPFITKIHFIKGGHNLFRNAIEISNLILTR